MCEPFVLRMAGFPFAWLEELSDPAVSRAAAMVAAAEREQESLVAKTHTEALLGAIPRDRHRKVLRAARSGQGPLDVDGIGDPSVTSLLRRVHSHWGELRLLEQEFRARYREGIERGRGAVRRRFVEDETLRDMLFVLNPGSYPIIEHWLEKVSLNPADWRMKDRTKLDPLTLYLQRACAKNDSTGLAGPFCVGRFDRANDGIRAADVPLARRVFLSRWAAEAILARLSSAKECPSVCAPRRAPGARIDAGEVENLLFDDRGRGDMANVIGDLKRHPELSVIDRQVLGLCDGARTPDAIRSALQGFNDIVEEPTAHDVMASLDRLSAAGLIIRGPEIPYGVEDPLPILTQVAEATGAEPFRALVSLCAETICTLSTGRLEARTRALGSLSAAFHEVTGEEPVRRGGGFYADRALVFEESEGRLESLVVGSGLVERIERQLPLILDTYLFVPRHRLRLEGDLLSEWFARRFPAKTAPVNDYLRAFVDDRELLQPELDAAERAAGEFSRALKDAAVDAVAGGNGSTRARLREFLVTRGFAMPAVCNVDLMFGAAAGAGRLAEPNRLVVSEVQTDEEALTHGMFAPFVEKICPGFTDEIRRGYQSLLAEGEILVDVTLRHSNKTFARRHLGCPDIEAGDRSPCEPSLRRHLSDLVVVREDAGLRLIEHRSGRAVRLIAVPFSWRGIVHNPMHIFGFPKRRSGTLFHVGAAGECLPEIAFDDLVLSRRAWSVMPNEIRAGSAEESFLAMRRLRDRLGLPRHLYMRTPEETKPIYGDLDSPLLVRQMSRLAGRASAVILSEMVPAPGELWLRSRGEAFTSEIRFAAFARDTHATAR